MRFNLLDDYLRENGFSDSFRLLTDDKSFGHLYINGRVYPVRLSLSINIPDNLCNSVIINGRTYRFCVENIPIDKCIEIN